MQKVESLKQTDTKQLDTMWFESITRLAMQLMNMYSKAPHAMENLLLNGHVMKELFAMIYNLYVSTRLIKPIEKLDQAGKADLWREVKSLEKKYRTEPLSIPHGIKISKAIHVLSYLCDTYLQKSAGS